MDLEGVLSLVLFVLHWRVALCLVGTSALAFILVGMFPWLTGLQGIAIAALGLALGAAWEAKAASAEPAPNSNAPETSTAVACAAAVIAGSAWGALSSTSFHSFLAGAAIFLLAAKAWSWYASDMKRWVTKERLYLCVTLAGLTYPIAALVSHNAL